MEIFHGFRKVFEYLRFAIPTKSGFDAYRIISPTFALFNILIASGMSNNPERFFQLFVKRWQIRRKPLQMRKEDL